jgi:hypothetical protein
MNLHDGYVSFSLVYKDGAEVPGFINIPSAVNYARGVALTAGNKAFKIIRIVCSEVFTYEPPKEGVG